jgi:ATP-binding cassette subfamily B protein
LSTVRDAEQIIVLDHGRVVESGRFEDLILAGGRFSALAARTEELASPTAADAPLVLTPELAPE